ncbi:MAG TPA: MFS transporter [Candidatus Limnocylindria bacterium]|nr:MFS transporter [Candidatus Limnocylindria bacterium]
MADQPLPAAPRGLGPRAVGGIARGFSALKVRNYRLYWSGQVVSLVGTWMQQVSLPWLVLALGGSPLQLGVVAALEFLPATVLAPFGGVVADRVDKRKALIGAQIGSAIQAFVLFLLAATGVAEIWMVMVLGLARGFVNAVEMPTRQALAADLVPRHILPNAIALNSMAFNSARVVGPAAAGIIIAIGTAATGSAMAGIAVNFAVNTLTFGAVVAGLLMMDPAQIRRSVQPERHPPVLHSLREGFAYALRTPLVLWCLILLGGIASFGFNFQILLPLFAQEVLKLGAEGYGALYAAMGVGSLAGSMTLAVMQRRRVLPLMIGGGAVFCLLLAGIGIVRTVLPVAILVAGVGYFSMLMVNTINATVQANVSDALRGRVMSLYVMVFAASAPIGGLFAGGVAEAWGTPAAFLIGALLSAIVVALFAWALHSAGKRGPLGVIQLDDSTMAEEARRTPARATAPPQRVAEEGPAATGTRP